MPDIADLDVAAREVFGEQDDKRQLREVGGLEGDGSEGEPRFRAHDRIHEDEERSEERERERIERHDGKGPADEAEVRGGEREVESARERQEEKLARRERAVHAERAYGQDSQERERERGSEQCPVGVDAKIHGNGKLGTTSIESGVAENGDVQTNTASASPKAGIEETSVEAAPMTLPSAPRRRATARTFASGAAL